VGDRGCHEGKFQASVDFFIFLNDDILIISKVLSTADKISGTGYL